MENNLLSKLKGKLVVIEGPEGAGKSLISENLKKALSLFGLSVTLSREPGGVEVSEKIRNILINDNMHPITEAYLFIAARAEHLQKVIKPALQRGDVVILDRFFYSTLAIQGYAEGLNVEELRRIHRLALDGVLPNYSFFLDVPPEYGLKRKFAQNEVNKFELQGIEFHNKVYNGLCEMANNKELIKINGMQSPEKMVDDILNYIKLY